MRKNNLFAAELLRQEGLTPEQLNEAEKKDFDALLNQYEKQRTYSDRMRWATYVSWALVILCVIVFGWGESVRHGSLWVSSGILVTRTFILLALFLSISYYVRFRATSTTELRLRMAKLEMMLREFMKQ